MTIHELKTWPEHFGPILSGAKTAEMRCDDRGFESGDELLLQECARSSLGPEGYTGREVRVTVTHILRDFEFAGLAHGYVMLSFRRICDMRRVIVESPYAGDIDRNVAYARACVADCLQRGEAPFASHLFYTQPGILDDAEPEERRLGIDAGLAWGQAADATVVYADLGIAPGMKQGVERAIAEGRVVEERTLGHDETLRAMGVTAVFLDGIGIGRGALPR